VNGKKALKIYSNPEDIGFFYKLSFTKQSLLMRSLLYLFAVVLVIGWLLGFFVYSVGGIIHILLVIAVISILLDIIGGRRRV
jgi:predicted ferric reductase